MKKFLLSLLTLAAIIFAGLWLTIDINPDRVTTIFG